MKNIFRCIIEIFLAVLIMVFSYPLFKAKDVKAYEEEISNFSNIKTEIYVGDDFNTFYDLESKDNIEKKDTLFINNYKNKNDSFKLILKLDNASDNLINNLYLLKNDNVFNLKDILVKEDSNSAYCLIDNVDLDPYEKESYNIRLLINDEYLDNNEGIDYSFIKQ